ncbi:MAG: PKD domain-containing protein [Bacteroidota bacterium]
MIQTPYLSGLRSILTIILLSLFLFNSLAQNITETRWYFGNSAESLLFDRNGRDVNIQTDQATPFGSGGSVTITDQFTGNLLFYSDGVNLLDISHNSVPTLGGGLSGNPTINVPVVACPVTGNRGQYYLFTNSSSGGADEIQYSVADANLTGNGTAQFPYGDLVTGMINQPTGITDPSEGMLIIPLGDGENFWLITQNRNSYEIQVTPIGQRGIGTPSPFNFVDGGTPGFEASHFAFNPDSSKLAMAPKTANRNIWLLDFSPLDGSLALDTVLTGTGFDDGANESIYDVEWSADGSKLYFSRFGGTGSVGQVYQLDFNDSIQTTIPVLPNDVFRSYGLKKAIDNRIYHLYQETDASSPFSLGRINRPDSIADSVSYQTVVFSEDFSSRQFSEFTPGYQFLFDSLNFYWIDSCATNVTKFFPIVDPVPNTLSWDFDMAGTSDQWIPTIEFPMEGSYMVSMTVEVAGVDTTITQFVEIFANDLMVDLGNDTTICIDEVLTLDAGTGVSFVWNTGETTQTIEVDTTGTYWVEVTNALGCTDFDDIEVLEYGVTEQIYNQWYFGERAGIDFNNGAIAILDGNNQDAEEGCATISDVNGDLLFYTNGVTVWNREHDVMVNGDDIGGDLLSAQNSLIMPFGGDQTMFYIFTTEQVYGDDEYALKYAIVDMKEDSSFGKVIIKNVKIMENSTERITGSGFTGNDLIVAHEFGNNTFRTFTTSDEGLSGAVFSPSGAVHEFMDELNATSYMKISPTFNQIAVLITGTNQVEILDFDQGEVSNPRLIDTGENGLYGLEFSPSGNRLYVTTSSKLIQYDLDSLNSADPVTDIEATKFEGYAQGAGYGALQIGPDGVIYMAVDNSGTIGNITSPEGDDAANGFDPAGFNLEGRTSRLGLPNFAQVENTPTQEPSITVVPGCVGQTSTFSAVGRDPNNSIENYFWVFGDGASAPVQDTTHVYDQPGTYTVQMILSNRCDTDTILTEDITINTIPESPIVPTDTALCDQSILLEAWPVDDPDLSYLWSTGDTTRQITVSEPAIIDVTITNINTGCPSDTATVIVADARPDVNLGNNRVFCQDDPPEILDAQIINATSYQWYIDGVAAGTNRTLEANTSVAGVFEYAIEVINLIGCIGRDTLEVTILEAPDISFTGNNTTGCGVDDGFIELTFNATGSYAYEITGPDSRGPFNVDSQGPSLVTIPTGASAPGDGDLPPGNYNLMVTDLVNGCVRNEVVQVEDPGNLGLTSTAPSACVGEGEISVNFATMTPSTFDIVIDYEDGSNVLNTGLTSVYTNPVIQSLDTGSYFITVTDTDPAGLGCTETDEVRIELANPQPAFTFDTPQLICGSEGEIYVADETSEMASYTWSGPGIVGSNMNDTITVNQPGAYSVTADGTNFCPRTEQIEVQFNTDPMVTIDIQGDPCEGEVTLVAQVMNGSGSYVYNWNDGSQAAQNVVMVSSTYFVTVTDQLTGCEVASDDVVITVEEEFEVELALDPDCENNGQVFVIATTNYFDPSITYEWQDGEGNTLNTTDSILTVSSSGTYTVVATNETGSCIVSDALEVAVVPINPEDILLPGRVTFCRADPSDPTVTLDPGIFNTYEWRLLPDETVISTDPTLTVAEEGMYEVTLFNGFTCITVQVQVDEDCSPVVFAPNAFTPEDGNGVNDDFFVFPNNFVDDFEILIFTRWGELVFRSENRDFRWNGIYRGQLLPPGTYAYIMKFSSLLEPELGTIEQYGAVTLIR